MIVERLVFRTKFGQGDTVARAFQSWLKRFGERFGVEGRCLVDLTGPMFTVVVENQYRDLAQMAELQASQEEFYASPEFQEWFGGWSAATENGTRELYRVVA